MNIVLTYLNSYMVSECSGFYKVYENRIKSIASCLVKEKIGIISQKREVSTAPIY